MTPVEVNVLLTKAATVDVRMKRSDVDERVAMAESWAEVLDEVSLEDALDALKAHYRESSASVMPGDIVRIVRDEHGDVPVLSQRDAWLMLHGFDPEEFDRLVAGGESPRELLADRGIEIES